MKPVLTQCINDDVSIFAIDSSFFLIILNVARFKSTIYNVLYEKDLCETNIL